MKQFKTDYNGLLPILLDDIRFVQEAYDEQIEALIKPYLEFTDNNSFILSGCEYISGNNYSAGWIVLEGKVYRVPAFELPTAGAGQVVVWGITSTALTGGLKRPKRSPADVNTWYEKTVVPVIDFDPSSSVLYTNTNRLKEILSNIHSDTGWINLVINQGWVFELTDRPQYRLYNGVVYMRGTVSREGNLDGVIAILPTGKAPARLMQFYEDVVVENVSGSERLRYTLPISDVAVKLDSICYPLG
jgi:hypothetical protein